MNRGTSSKGSGVALDYVSIRGQGDSLTQAWRKAGFHIQEGKIVVGGLKIQLEEASSKVSNFSNESSESYVEGVDLLKFRNLPHRVDSILDRIPVGRSSESLENDTSCQKVDWVENVLPHPNGINRVDHVVIRTNKVDLVEDFMRNTMKMTLRRRLNSDAGAMLFFRESDQPDCPIIEVVGSAEDFTGTSLVNASVWGISFVADDLELVRSVIGEKYVSEIRNAKQPGRSICTVKLNGLGMHVAVMTPHIARRARL